MPNAGDQRSRELILALHRLTWAASQKRGGYFAQDRLLERVVADPGLDRVMVADHARSALSAIAKPEEVSEATGPVPAGRLHARPRRLRRTDPVSVAAARRAYRRYEQTLKRKTHRAGMRKPAVLTTNAMTAGFGTFDWAGPVTYFATDDFAAGEERRPVGPVYRAAYEALRDKGVRTAAVTDSILAEIDSPGPRLVVPNGIDPDEWNEPATEPAWFSAVPRPRIVYFGSLDRRIDIEAVRAAADATDNGSVIAIGYVSDRGRFATLESRPDVDLVGQVSRRELIGIARASDVGLVPHLVSRATLGMSPLKVYEYLAAGLPVVATPLTQLAHISPRIITEPAERFGEGVRAALAQGRATEAERARFVEANSWRSRHDSLLGFALAPRVPSAVLGTEAHA